MQDNPTNTCGPITLDAAELLGFSLFIKVAGNHTGTACKDSGKIGVGEADSAHLGRLLNKVGNGEMC
jgi:hypothetical protein